MENSSKEFRESKKIKEHCLDGNVIESTDDDVLKEYFEFYTTQNKKESNKRIEEDEDIDRYLESIEKMLKLCSKDKVSKFIYNDYNKNKISKNLLKKALTLLGKESEIKTAKFETRMLSEQEVKELDKLMEGKHPITRIQENEENEK